MKLIEEQKRSKVEIRAAQLAGLRRLCRHFSYNRTLMAEELGVERNAVYQWFHRGRISAEYAVIAEEVTRGGVTKQQLRPDVEMWWNEEAE